MIDGNVSKLLAGFTHDGTPLAAIVGSKQKSQAIKQDNDHRLILGAIRRISGSMQPEAEVRLAG
ncbi:MAG: hypothetical protein EBW38_19375, partial [Rhodobacteraceae bacterium]|nr:hypothetical protein [Paracoccaceae bacterium]